MKRSYLLFFFTAFLISCKKENEQKDFRRTFTGIWEFRQFTGYPLTGSPLPQGNGKIIILSNKGDFERRVHDTLLFRGSYFLEERKDCHGPDPKVFFTTNDSSFAAEAYINIADGELTLSTPNCFQDGGTSYWRKVEKKSE